MYAFYTNTWTGIIKVRGHHASKFGIIYSNGHIGFNYTYISLILTCAAYCLRAASMDIKVSCGFPRGVLSLASIQNCAASHVAQNHNNELLLLT